MRSANNVHCHLHALHQHKHFAQLQLVVRATRFEATEVALVPHHHHTVGAGRALLVHAVRRQHDRRRLAASRDVRDHVPMKRRGTGSIPVDGSSKMIFRLLIIAITTDSSRLFLKRAQVQLLDLVRHHAVQVRRRQPSMRANDSKCSRTVSSNSNNALRNFQI